MEEGTSQSSEMSVPGFQQFHSNHGSLVQLSEDRLSACRLRPSHEFNQGLVFSSLPLRNDELFEVRIDRKVHSWTGSLQIGVTSNDPSTLDPAPPNALDIVNKSWVLSGCNLFENGKIVVEDYGPDLDELNEGDRVGVMRTSEGDLVLYVNSFAQGVAVTGIPESVWACVDLYGKCVQVTAMMNRKEGSLSRPLTLNTAITTSSLSGVDSNQEDEDSQQILVINGGSSCVSTPGSISSSASVGIVDRLRFHHRCGTMVKLSAGQRTAERRRPLDEFNNGVVMTQRPLMPDELFEIRIDNLVDKWSGSIEVGITTHNPQALDFPSTMTNLRSGTIMMSGCGILTNGKGTRREYGQCNLDELVEADRIGLIRQANGELHFYVNGRDQGVAASNVPSPVWGVVDLYGRTVKVSLIDREDTANKPPSEIAEAPEEVESDADLMAATLMTSSMVSTTTLTIPDNHRNHLHHEPLLFHSRCGIHAAVINAGQTAHRPNAQSDFNHGVVLTNRPLKPDELFEVVLDRIVLKWAGSIEIGVTTQPPDDLDLPATMTNVRSGTWMMTGNGVMHNGLTILDDYGSSLDRLGSGDRVGVQRRSNGVLHFYVNGEDQGPAAGHVPENVYGVVDLYGQAAQVTIVNHSSVTPSTENSSPYPSYLYRASLALAPLVSPSSLADSTYALPSTASSGSPSTSSSSTLTHTDLSFHRLHGRNTTLVNNSLTAFRPNALSEFNDAICMTSRPLRPGEMFEVVIEKLVERWSGSLELGVTAIHPENLDFPATMTDIDYETWMLSGSSVMQDGTITRNGYPLDLDALQEGSRVGLLRHADGSLHYYLDGQDQGAACWNVPSEIYAVIDLYGQCAQVSLVHRPLVASAIPPHQEMSVTSQARQRQMDGRSTLDLTNGTSYAHGHRQQELHRLSCQCGRAITILDEGRSAKRDEKDFENGLVFSADPLQSGEVFEIRIEAIAERWAGSLSIGLTTFHPHREAKGSPASAIPSRIDQLAEPAWYISGVDLAMIEHPGFGQDKDAGASHWDKLVTPSPSLCVMDHLQVGDCISVSRQASSIRFAVNGQDLELPPFRSYVPVNSCHVVIDLHGVVQSVSVISSGRGARPGPESLAVTPAHVVTSTPANETIASTTERSSSGLPLSLSQLALREAVQGIQSALSSRFGAAFNAQLQNQQQQQQQQPLRIQQQPNQQQRFHDHHGRNVSLKNNGQTAHRMASYNQGLLYSKEPLMPGSPPFQVRIEQLDERWTGSIMLGVTANSPDKMSGSPTCALLLKRPSWVVCGRAVHQGVGRRLSPVDLPFDLNRLRVGQTAGIYLSTTGHLGIVLDGQDQGAVAHVGLDQVLYAVVDLYGACLQASLVLPGEISSSVAAVCPSQQQPVNSSMEEKALRECSNSEKVLRTPRSCPGNRPCRYKASCARLIRLMGLPDAYLEPEGSQCGCQQCFDDTDTSKANAEMKGWCRWKVRTRRRVETATTTATPTTTGTTKKDDTTSGCNEKWQTAYHATRPAVVRRILDEGQLLPPDLKVWQRARTSARHRSDKGHDGESDGQMLFFSPSLQQPAAALSAELYDPSLKKMQRGHVVLQVLVQPGSYKVRRATSPINGPAPSVPATTTPSHAASGAVTAPSEQILSPSSLNPSLPSPGPVTLTIPPIQPQQQQQILLGTPSDEPASNGNIVWYTKERGAAIVQALLIRADDEASVPSS